MKHWWDYLDANKGISQHNVLLAFQMYAIQTNYNIYHYNFSIKADCIGVLRKILIESGFASTYTFSLGDSSGNYDYNESNDSLFFHKTHTFVISDYTHHSFDKNKDYDSYYIHIISINENAAKDIIAKFKKYIVMTKALT